MNFLDFFFARAIRPVFFASTPAAATSPRRLRIFRQTCYPQRPPVLPGSTIALVVALLCTGALPVAHAGILDDLTGKEDKDWIEQPPELPASPVAADQIPFYVSAASTFHFAIDAKSLSIGGDGVVHYTLIATSSDGARNVSFEGIRCHTREYKVYAYGESNGTFTARDDPQWKRIDEAAANRQRAALYKEYFCPSGLPRRNAEIIAALKQRPYDSISQ